jgi:hypothetical protein
MKWQQKLLSGMVERISGAVKRISGTVVAGESSQIMKLI